jgi:hypothetical protein
MEGIGDSPMGYPYEVAAVSSFPTSFGEYLHGSIRNNNCCYQKNWSCPLFIQRRFDGMLDEFTGVPQRQFLFYVGLVGLNRLGADV